MGQHLPRSTASAECSLNSFWRLNPHLRDMITNKGLSGLMNIYHSADASLQRVLRRANKNYLQTGGKKMNKKIKLLSNLTVCVLQQLGSLFELVFMKFSGLKQRWNYFIIRKCLPGCWSAVWFQAHYSFMGMCAIGEVCATWEKKKDILPALLEMHKLQTDWGKAFIEAISQHFTAASTEFGSWWDKTGIQTCRASPSKAWVSFSITAEKQIWVSTWPLANILQTAAQDQTCCSETC